MRHYAGHSIIQCHCLFLADQLTLFQPGGQINTNYAHDITTASQIFGLCGVSATGLVNTKYVHKKD